MGYSPGVRYSPAHFDLVARMRGRLGASPVISYMGGSAERAGDVFLTARPVNFRNSIAATRQTIDIMRSLVWGSVGTPIIHRAAGAVRQMARMGNEPLANALHRWVRMNINYVPDESLVEQGAEGRELLIAPNVLLAMNPAEGDCDDFSMAAAAIAASLGLSVKFVAVALEQENPTRYSHIFIQVLDNIGPNGEKDWVTLDCSHGMWAGWEVGNQLARYEQGL